MTSIDTPVLCPLCKLLIFFLQLFASVNYMKKHTLHGYAGGVCVPTQRKRTSSDERALKCAARVRRAVLRFHYTHDNSHGMRSEKHCFPAIAKFKIHTNTWCWGYPSQNAPEDSACRRCVGEATPVCFLVYLSCRHN